jgi:glycosyltransferase involved in cell wall biosynthesis
MAHLVTAFRRSKPDVLHTHDLPPHLLGSPAAWLARVPVVIHTRHFRTGKLTFRHALAARAASALSTAVVAVSEDSAGLLGSEGVATSKLLVIHNGADVQAFAPGDRWTRPPGRRVISVGRLSPVKDYPTLLQAARRVVACLPDFRLDIVGDGPSRASLGALRTELGLESCVRFLGERHDVAELLASADAFALASTSEGLSISLLEALAAGLPIVATRVGGNPEIVEDGVTGVLVSPGDVDAVATALVSLLSDAGRLTSMARAARLRAEQHFDLRRVVARYEALYVERLASGGRYLSWFARGF